MEHRTPSGGTAFSISALSNAKKEDAAAKAAKAANPREFLRKGSRTSMPTANAVQPSPVPVKREPFQAPPSVKSYIQDYKREAAAQAKRDKFDDALVVAVPKKVITPRMQEEYQMATENAALAYQRAKEEQNRRGPGNSPSQQMEDRGSQDGASPSHYGNNEPHHQAQAPRQAWNAAGSSPQSDHQVQPPRPAAQRRAGNTVPQLTRRPPEDAQEYEDEEPEGPTAYGGGVGGGAINPMYSSRPTGPLEGQRRPPPPTSQPEASRGYQPPPPPPPGRDRRDYSEEDYDRAGGDDYAEYDQPRQYGARRPMDAPSSAQPPRSKDTFKQFLVEKMKELEDEIATYKKENGRLLSMTREQEHVLQRLVDEKRAAEQNLEEDRMEFERYKEEELDRLKAKAKQMEQRAREVAKIVPRKEREEIDQLNQQLESLRDEVRQKEARWKAERDRLRKQIDELNVRNTQLENSIREQQLDAINRDFEARMKTREGGGTGGGGAAGNRNGDGVAGLSRGIRKVGYVDEEEKKAGSAPGGLPPRPRIGDKGNQNAMTVSRPTLMGGKTYGVTNDADQEEDQEEEEEEEVEEIEEEEEEAEGALKDEHAEGGDDDDEVDVVENRPGDSVAEERTFADGKQQRTYSSGKREIIYTNGTVKVLLPSGHAILRFSNGDVKKTFPKGKVVYFYALAQTTHTTFANELQVFEFANQQIEKHFPDGMKEIMFPDGTVKYIYPDGSEENLFMLPSSLSVQTARQLVKSNGMQTIAKVGQAEKKKHPAVSANSSKQHPRTIGVY